MYKYKRNGYTCTSILWIIIYIGIRTSIRVVRNFFCADIRIRGSKSANIRLFEPSKEIIRAVYIDTNQKLLVFLRRTTDFEAAVSEVKGLARTAITSREKGGLSIQRIPHRNFCWNYSSTFSWQVS